jgi:hypothetical protein
VAEWRVAGLSTVAAQGPDLSMETGRRLGDTLHHAVKAASARALSAVTSAADRQGAFHHAEAAAWVGDLVAVVAGMAAEAGVGKRSVVVFLLAVRVRNGEKPYAANQAELR